MQTHIRKWGNSAGAIIPAGALLKAGICLGDTLTLDVQEGVIILKQISPSYTLDDLLKASPKKAFSLDQEDNDWLHDGDLGGELY